MYRTKIKAIQNIVVKMKENVKIIELLAEEARFLGFEFSALNLCYNHIAHSKKSFGHMWE